MARTNLIQVLQRAYRIASFAAQQKISAATASEILATRISRRRLLQASLATASGAAALALEQLHQPTAPPRINPLS